MTATQDILRAGLAAQSAGLVFNNLNSIKKKKKPLKKVVELGVTNILGTSLISAQGNLIEGL